jgi:hypothetical protein
MTRRDGQRLLLVLVSDNIDIANCRTCRVAVECWYIELPAKMHSS